MGLKLAAVMVLLGFGIRKMSAICHCSGGGSSMLASQ